MMPRTFLLRAPMSDPRRPPPAPGRTLIWMVVVAVLAVFAIAAWRGWS